jgi:hypothetical protein
MDIVGTRGFKGKKAKNSHTQFNILFEEHNGAEEPEDDFDEDKLDQLESMK